MHSYQILVNAIPSIDIDQREWLWLSLMHLEDETALLEQEWISKFVCFS